MYVHELGGSGWEKKATKRERQQQQLRWAVEQQKRKRIKLQLNNERCSMDGGCHGERMKLDGEKETWRKFFIFVFLSPLVQATPVT